MLIFLKYGTFLFWDGNYKSKGWDKEKKVIQKKESFGLRSE